MIICPNSHADFPDCWICVKQSDHDDHCGYIAAHWTSTTLWQPTSKRLLTIAVALHDTGSANWEDRALINAQGEPWTYWTIPPDDHLELHRHGVRVACEVHPYAGLLISMHVVGIHRDRLHIDPAPNRWHMPEHHTLKVEAFVAEQTALQADLKARLREMPGFRHLDDERLMNDFKLFEVIDILSTQFAACGLADREMVYVPDAGGQPVTLSLRRLDEWTFRVMPFPFEGSRFEVPLPARAIPMRAFADHDEYREAWYRAPLFHLPYVCVA
jgi:Protein of unknown function (DUF3891)